VILLTVGTQLPFDRLVAGVDRWVAGRPGARVFAQVGEGGAPAPHLTSVQTLSASSYDTALRSATAVVSHAGMGVVLAALESGTPLIVMPRRADLGEHRSEHQLEVCQRQLEPMGVTVVHDESQLHKALDRVSALSPPTRPDPRQLEGLLDGLRRFVTDGAVSAAGVAG